MPDIFEGADAAANTSTAYTLSVGQTAQGQLISNSDHDYFRVNLVAGQIYTVAMTGTGVNNVVDPFVRVYGANGTTLIASNDDGLPGGNSIVTFTAQSTGAYFIDAGSFNNGGSGQYGVSVTQGTRASLDIRMGAGVIDTDLAWTATPGTGATVTYGYRQSAASYTLNGSDLSTFSQFTVSEIAAVEQILPMFSDVCNLNFTRVNPSGYTNSATILFANYNDPHDGAGAFGYYPGGTGSGNAAGDVWLNRDSVNINSLPVGSYSFYTIIHEIGHAVGLSHPGLYDATAGGNITYNNSAQFVQDSHQYSVMSYFDESVTGANLGGYPDTLMMFDIYALQQIYGANWSTRAGNTIYGFGSNAGSIYDFSVNTSPGLCIWDGGGSDILNCAGYSQSQVINLTDGLFSNIGGRIGNVSIAIGAIIEDAIGGSGADTIIGNAANNAIFAGDGADTVIGGDGNDTLVAHSISGLFMQVADSLSGGNGNDTLYGDAFDTLNGGAGFDVLQVINAYDMSLDLAAASIEYVVSDFGNDVYMASMAIGAVEVYGSGGNDTITGGYGDDRLWGGVGSDILAGNDGNDVLVGDLGADSLSGGAGNDRLYIDPSDTFIDGGGDFDAAYIASGSGIILDMAATNLEWVTDFANGNDIIDASATSTGVQMYAAGGVDYLMGGSGDDRLFAGIGDDTLRGNAGNDVLVGEAGADRLIGGFGNDVLYGGTEGDTFVWTSGGGTDTVMTWDDGSDMLEFNQVVGLNDASDLTIVSNGGNAEVFFGADRLFIVFAAAGFIGSGDLLFT